MQQHADHEVEILDDDGRIAAVKPRKDVDKSRDILHVAYVFLITPDSRLILSRIPRDPQRGHLFPGKLAVTAATVVRHQEHHEAAAQRALNKELRASVHDLTFLGETMETFPNSPKRLIAAYIATAELERLNPNPEDVEELIAVTKAELEVLLQKKTELAPTLLTLWSRYNERIDG